MHVLCVMWKNTQISLKTHSKKCTRAIFGNIFELNTVKQKVERNSVYCSILEMKQQELHRVENYASTYPWLSKILIHYTISL
jgi:hypothetical protein